MAVMRLVVRWQDHRTNIYSKIPHAAQPGVPSIYTLNKQSMREDLSSKTTWHRRFFRERKAKQHKLVLSEAYILLVLRLGLSTLSLWNAAQQARALMIELTKKKGGVGMGKGLEGQKGGGLEREGLKRFLRGTGLLFVYIFIVLHIG